EVAALDVDDLARLDRANRAPTVAVCPVDPTVEPEVEAVEAVLLVPLAKPGEEELAMVGLAVAVAVLGVEDVRGRGDKHPPSPGHHAGGKRQAFQERGRFVVDSITVSVFQEPHDAPGLALAIDSERIIPH